MLTLLERTISSLDRRLVLLAPQSRVSAFFTNVEADSRRHRELVREMQKLRGSIYMHDGALGREQLSAEGLHETDEDDQSWHLLMMDSRHKITGCAWYLEHDVTKNAVRLDDLRVRHSPLARMDEWRDQLKKGVESELERAHREKLRYAEVGGWAVSKNSRCTSEGLVLALAGYSLGRLRGGCLGITTATVRHCSSSILRRIGGAPLEADGATVPSYYDPRYKCEMEILRFDSRNPAPKFSPLIDRLRDKLATVPVITREPVRAFEHRGTYFDDRLWAAKAAHQSAVTR
jgi:hypothetical protein